MKPTEPTSCRDCLEELAHCHETLVVHLDGHAECLDSDCREPREVHVHITSCLDLNEVCLCQKVGDAIPLAA